MSAPGPRAHADSAAVLRGGRLAALLVGAFLVAAFFGLTETSAGFAFAVMSPPTMNSPGEAYMWLANAMLLLPGACSIGWALAPYMPSAVRRALVERAPTAPERASGVPAESASGGSVDAPGASLADRRRIGPRALAVVFALGLASAAAGHEGLVRGYPLTDAENAVRFGGELLAAGRVTIPTREPAVAFPSFGLYVHDGLTSSGEWLGGQVVWALALWSGLGTIAFAILAALPAAFVAATVGRCLGRTLGLAAGAALLLSPMGAALSVTTHPYLVSRAFLAVALYLRVRAGDSGSRRTWAASGLALGAALAAHPLPVVALAAPLLALDMARAARDRATLVRWAAFASGLALPVAALALHAWAVTGNPLLPPPVSGGLVGAAPAFGTPWEACGIAAHGLLNLAVWFLGPAGLLLVALGALETALTRALALGLGLALCVSVFDPGADIHAVGPLRLAEGAVPLAVLAAFGAARTMDALGRFGRHAADAACTIALGVVVSLAVADALVARSLRAQAAVQETIYGEIERQAGAGPAVVLVPPLQSVSTRMASTKGVGTWLAGWAPVPPFASSGTLVLFDVERAVPELRERYANRAFYRLVVSEESPYVVLEPMKDAEGTRR